MWEKLTPEETETLKEPEACSESQEKKVCFSCIWCEKVNQGCTPAKAGSKTKTEKGVEAEDRGARLCAGVRQGPGQHCVLGGPVSRWSTLEQRAKSTEKATCRMDVMTQK